MRDALLLLLLVIFGLLLGHRLAKADPIVYSVDLDFVGTGPLRLSGTMTTDGTLGMWPEGPSCLPVTTCGTPIPILDFDLVAEILGVGSASLTPENASLRNRSGLSATPSALRFNLITPFSFFSIQSDEVWWLMYDNCYGDLCPEMLDVQLSGGEAARGYRLHPAVGSFVIAHIPEPSSAALLGQALLMLCAIQWTRRNR